MKKILHKIHASRYYYGIKKDLTTTMMGSGHFSNLFNGVEKRHSQPRRIRTAVIVVNPLMQQKSFPCIDFTFGFSRITSVLTSNNQNYKLVQLPNG